MLPLQKAIARRARVSQSTVSRALNHHPGLPQTTCRRIQAIAHRLGYVANPLVSSIFSGLRTRASSSRSNLGTLAFLTAHKSVDGWLEVGTYRDFFLGAQARAAEHGFKVEPHWAAQPGLSGRRLSGILEARGIVGVIVSSRDRTLSFPALEWPKFAAVRIGRSQDRLPLHCAVNHQFNTVRLVADELRRRGYRRLGLVLSVWQNQVVECNWMGGFLAWQADQPRADRIPPHRPVQLTAASVLRWFDRHRPDAVISVNAAIIRWLQAGGRLEPGATGSALLDWHETDAALAGADQNNRLVGAAAVDSLLGQLSRNERGIPERAHTLLIESSWHDGPSVR